MFRIGTCQEIEKLISKESKAAKESRKRKRKGEDNQPPKKRGRKSNKENEDVNKTTGKKSNNQKGDKKKGMCVQCAHNQ